MSATIPPGGTDFAFIPIVPTKGEDKPIYFRAFIDSINDTYSPGWSEHMDMGRADPKFMYNQFSRTVSLDFKIASLKTDEHYENMKAMNSLASLVYPIYKPGRGFNGIYVRFYLGDFLQSIGFISSLSYAVDNESPWIDDLPLVVNCSLDIRCIGAKKPDYRTPAKSGPYYDGTYGKGIK